MARARNIKPGICKNEDLARCTIQARYLSCVLPCFADREGRLEDRPLRLKIEIFPADDGINVDALLNELQDAGFVLRYEKDNTKYIQIVKFKKHQSPHVKEQASTIPAPDMPGANTSLAPPDSHDCHDCHDSKPSRADTRAFEILKTEYGDRKGGKLGSLLLQAHVGPKMLELIEASRDKADPYAWLMACTKLRLPEDAILLSKAHKAAGLGDAYGDIEEIQARIMSHIAGDKALTDAVQAVVR